MRIPASYYFEEPKINTPDSGTAPSRLSGCALQEFWCNKTWATGEFQVPKDNLKPSVDEIQGIWKDPGIRSALELSHILPLTTTSFLFSQECAPGGTSGKPTLFVDTKASSGSHLSLLC